MPSAARTRPFARIAPWVSKRPTSLVDVATPAWSSNSWTRTPVRSLGRSTLGTSAATAASTSGPASVGISPEQHLSGPLGGLCGGGAVDELGHLGGERTLGQSLLGRGDVLFEHVIDLVERHASRASSGRRPPSRRRSASRTAGTGTARCGSGSSQTAPPTDLPNFDAVAAGHQRMRDRDAPAGPSRRRMSSTPATMLPHWSDAPACSSTPWCSYRCRKSSACSSM